MKTKVRPKANTFGRRSQGQAIYKSDGRYFICPVCDEEKHEREYYKNNTSTKGIQFPCKTCKRPAKKYAFKTPAEILKMIKRGEST